MPGIEGVIQFQLEHSTARLPAIPGSDSLYHWHSVMHETGLVGRDPTRYEGYAYGNTSLRVTGMQFLVTGSQTGDIAHLGPDNLALVEDCDIGRNRVRSRGMVQPSSECMTHAAIYAADPAARAVIHVHSPILWHQHERLGMCATPASVMYGTPAMGAAVAECVAANAGHDQGCIAMLGHEDGVICYGHDLDSVGKSLVEMLGRAGKN